MASNLYGKTHYETYAETTAKSGRKYWFFLGWYEMPDISKAVKVTKKFAYFDTPEGREKFRIA